MQKIPQDFFFLVEEVWAGEDTGEERAIEKHVRMKREMEKTFSQCRAIAVFCTMKIQHIQQLDIEAIISQMRDVLDHTWAHTVN